MPSKMIPLDCPDEETLLVLVSGELPAAQRDVTLTHVDHCDECRAVVGQLLEGGATPDARQIGRYRVLRPIGTGAMGIVYAAVDAELQRTVAIKVLRYEYGDPGRLEARLVGEARTLARLAHPNVVAAFEVGRSDGDVFIAMEFVDGETLASWLARARTTREIVAAFLQAGAGLAAAHAAGVVHRDVKPDNILVGRDGRVRVTDFGLASGAGHDLESVAFAGGSPIERTHAGALYGTPAYMAPEQLAGRPATPRSDQFAFAVALWEALHGERPFGGKTRDELIAAMASRPRTAGSRRVPARLRAALERALRRDPDERWPDLSALLARLHPFAQPPRRLPVVLGACAVVATATAVWFARRPAPPPPCDDGQVLLGDLWAQSRRDAVRRQFVTASPAHGAVVFGTVDAALQRYSTQWIAERDGACRATHHRHEQSLERLAARASCADLRRFEAASLITLFERADASIVERALAAVQSLVSPERCAWDTGDEDRPPDPRAPALERRLAEANARGLVGKREEATKLAEEVVRAATGEALVPVRIRALTVRGVWGRDVRGVTRAREDLREAAELALENHADALLADALIRLSIATSHAGLPSEAMVLAQLGRAAVARGGGDRSLAADAAEATCIAAVGGADLAAARTACLAARDRVVAVGIPDDVRLSELRTQLGMLAYREGRFAEALAAFEANVAAYRRMFGEGVAGIDTMRDNIGWTLIELGRAREAIPILEGVVARQKWGDAWNALAMAHRALGELLAARDAHERGADVAAQQGHHGNRFEALVGVAEVELQLARDAEAAHALAEAAQLAEAGGPAERARFHLARARLMRADPRAARAALDTAAAAIADSKETAGPVPRLRAEIAAVRAATNPATGITRACRDSSCSPSP